MPSTLPTAELVPGEALGLLACSDSAAERGSQVAESGRRAEHASPARQAVAANRVPPVPVPSAPVQSAAVQPAPVQPAVAAAEEESEDSCLPAPAEDEVLHRLAAVREQQGVSQRTMARRMGIELRRYKELEDPTRDLRLSELRQLQMALEVPLIDLLEDRNALSRPVEERAKLVKVMKTAVAISEIKSSPRIERMAQMLKEQLVDLMPELLEVSGWPQFGARRGPSAMGKALCQPIDTSHLGLSE
ncbi:MAG: helix-turn-helix transcriptional regulator [Planctomycetales bacterium]|nr:helix-turn-helix transcriptional regulator [Planctomycetales bacterium]